MQRDGKPVVARTLFTGAVPETWFARYRGDGALDETFPSGGAADLRQIVHFDDITFPSACGPILDADDRIVYGSLSFRTAGDVARVIRILP